VEVVGLFSSTAAHPVQQRSFWYNEHCAAAAAMCTSRQPSRCCNVLACACALLGLALLCIVMCNFAHYGIGSWSIAMLRYKPYALP
jgi:hypothetical protein